MASENPLDASCPTSPLPRSPNFTNCSRSMLFSSILWSCNSFPHSDFLFLVSQALISNSIFSTRNSFPSFTKSGTTVEITTIVIVVINAKPIRNTERIALTRLGFFILAKSVLALADILPSKKSTIGFRRKAKIPATAKGSRTGVRRSNNHPTP